MSSVKHCLECYLEDDKKELYTIKAILASLSLILEDNVLHSILSSLPEDEKIATVIENETWYVVANYDETKTQTNELEIATQYNVSVALTEDTSVKKWYLTRKGIQHFLTATENRFPLCQPLCASYAKFLVRFWEDYKPLVLSHIQERPLVQEEQIFLS